MVAISLSFLIFGGCTFDIVKNTAKIVLEIVAGADIFVNVFDND